MTQPVSAADTERPRGTLNERRWEEVVAAAALVFEEQGYPTATLADIGRRVGLLKGSLYYYISSKEDLLFEILQRGYALGLALIEEPAGVAGAEPPVRLAEFIRRWTEGVLDAAPRMHFVERDVQHLGPERRAVIQAMRERIHGFAVDIVGDGIERGFFDSSVDPGVVANNLFNVLNTTGRWYRGTGPLAREEIIAWYTKLFLRGVGYAAG
ncbi:MAG TPA: TetR/AcrR family transcriptional regulator [Acidimicrobiales bacterium]|nr:TetR/AcrR family transcriptional regulator [Acidimicrobiales bacterium]